MPPGKRAREGAPLTKGKSERFTACLALLQPTLIVNERWPEAGPADDGVLAAGAYVDSLAHNLRLAKIVRGWQPHAPSAPAPAR